MYVPLSKTVFGARPHHTQAAIGQHRNVIELLVHARCVGDLVEKIPGDVIDKDVGGATLSRCALEDNKVPGDSRIMLEAWQLQLGFCSADSRGPENAAIACAQGVIHHQSP